MNPKNLKVYSSHDSFIQQLESFGIVQKGHFEYKKVFEDGTRAHGEYYINYRMLSTAQELELVKDYASAIKEWFGSEKNVIIVGVAMASLSLPKVVQVHLYPETGIEYAYTEKREGVLGLFGEQADKCRGKHLLFIEDVCNNATSSAQLSAEYARQKDTLGLTGYSILYGVHRGNVYPEEPQGQIYAMGHIKAGSYHKSDCPVCKEGKVPLKEYKKEKG